MAAENETSIRDDLMSAFKDADTDPAAAVAAELSPPAAPEPVSTEPQEPDTRTDAERARDEATGRFVSKGAAKQAETPVETPAAAPADKYAGPPPGWSVAAKAAFDTLPPDVRQSIAKREEEIDKGLAKLREYKGLDAYAETAKRHNLTLPAMIDRYQAAEKFLERSPAEGIKWLAQQYGVDLAKLAGTPTDQTPAPTARPTNDPVMQELAALKQIVYGDKQQQVANQVERFFADPKNKYAENVSDQMLVLINHANASGKPVDLDAIYQDACYMNPEVRDAIINDRISRDAADKIAKAKATASQARAAGASIAGGPASTPPSVSPDLPLRAMLEQQFANGRA